MNAESTLGIRVEILTGTRSGSSSSIFWSLAWAAVTGESTVQGSGYTTLNTAKENRKERQYLLLAPPPQPGSQWKARALRAQERGQEVLRAQPTDTRTRAECRNVSAPPPGPRPGTSEEKAEAAGRSGRLLFTRNKEAAFVSWSPLIHTLTSQFSVSGGPPESHTVPRRLPETTPEF